MKLGTKKALMCVFLERVFRIWSVIQVACFRISTEEQKRKRIKECWSPDFFFFFRCALWMNFFEKNINESYLLEPESWAI